MTFPRALARYTRGAVNTMTLRLAGHAAFADLEHTGRRSGTVRHTPVRAFRAGDTVVVGLNFGRQSDWYQNIEAAGTCRMRLGGELLTLGRPELVPAEEGVAGMPWPFRFALRHVIHTADCVRLPILGASRARPPIVNRSAPRESIDGPSASPGRPFRTLSVMIAGRFATAQSGGTVCPARVQGRSRTVSMGTPARLPRGGHPGVPRVTRHVGIARRGASDRRTEARDG
jgi:deazaflavin-dependent oxidoreductase (nitroreductase family)